jgi:hypothetical protein
MRLAAKGPPRINVSAAAGFVVHLLPVCCNRSRPYC